MVRWRTSTHPKRRRTATATIIPSCCRYIPWQTSRAESWARLDMSVPLRSVRRLSDCTASSAVRCGTRSGARPNATANGYRAASTTPSCGVHGCLWDARSSTRATSTRLHQPSPICRGSTAHSLPYTARRALGLPSATSRRDGTMMPRT